MIPLYLLAAHMVGDFVFQTRWQAAEKLTSVRYRMQHVAFYSVPFYVVLALAWPGIPRACGFLLGLMALHFATDSRRFLSTTGDVFAWYFGGAGPSQEKRAIHAAMGADLSEFDCPPNPWPSMPLMIDQSLHVVQLAALGGIFLA